MLIAKSGLMHRKMLQNNIQLKSDITLPERQ